MTAPNTFGHRFRITSFGESHGGGLGVVVDGCPAGVLWNSSVIEKALERRRPGQSAVVSDRRESDKPELLSGVFEGRTLGTPIALLTRNADARSQDYAALEAELEAGGNPRPGHADDVWRDKFGVSDVRGGGRASGRETWARVAGGAVAQLFVEQSVPGLRLRAWPARIAGRDLGRDCVGLPLEVESLLRDAKDKGLSYGGIVEARIEGLPAGLGQPVFHKLKADLAAAVMGIGATIGVEFGVGFAAADAEGSAFHAQGQEPYGGIRGGLSTGEALTLRVAFKPTSSVLHVARKGRHDPCIVPRAAPVVEAMLWLVVADHLLWQRTDRA
jgi:chorismate synthase